MFNIKNGVVPVSSKPSILGNMDLTMRYFSAFNVPFPGKNGTMSLCFGNSKQQRLGVKHKKGGLWGFKQQRD